MSPLPLSSNPTADSQTSSHIWNQKRFPTFLIAMVVAALAIRLIVMIFLLPEQLEPQRDHWRFGYETGRIARSIVQGRGFGNPLFEDTGPTAWMTPVYPYLVAGIFKVFGIYTKTSAIVLLSLNGLMSALVCVVVFFIARISFGERIAKWSGWAWAFCPYGIYFPMERIWETWLATLLLCLLFLLVLKLEKEETFCNWAAFGVLWGIAALTSPALLTVLPFLAGWVIYRRHRRGQRWFAVNAVAAVAFIAVVSPWFIRNYEVFHRFIPFRDNVGIVLLMGIKGDTSYWGPYELGPWHNPQQWNEFKQLGELAYFDEKKAAGDRVYSHSSRLVRVDVDPPCLLPVDRLLELRSRLPGAGAARSAEYSLLQHAHRSRASRAMARAASRLVRRNALCAGATFVSPHLLHHEPRSLLSPSAGPPNRGACGLRCFAWNDRARFC